MDTSAISSERDLYALWEHVAVAGACFRCCGGERVTVVACGRRNRVAGPDYLDAVLLLNGELICGAVEMHIEEGEWFAHGHDADTAYNAVVLHVVARRSARLRTAIPTMLAGALHSASQVASVSGEAHVKGESTAGDAAVGNTVVGDAVVGNTAAVLLAELAWARLLRRATAIVRAAPGIPITADATADEQPAACRYGAAFLRMMFDCLGYSTNRDPMRSTAVRLLEHEALLRTASFDRTVALLVSLAGIDPAAIERVGRGFMSAERLHGILNNSDLPRGVCQWHYGTRPANRPECRLWGAAKLVFDFYHGHLLPRLLEMVARGRLAPIVAALTVRMGTAAMVGGGRALEIVVNALLPIALAEGLARLGEPAGQGGAALVQGACGLYRAAPSLGHNSVLAAVERLLVGGDRLVGAFWQQGAIEYYQRYRTTDRRGLTFVAEPVDDVTRADRGQRPDSDRDMIP